MGTKEPNPPPLKSLLAGAVAGGLESLVTYPTEYVKTRKQLLLDPVSPLRVLVEVVREGGPGILYTGAGAFCLSNASKSGVRFLVFDTVRDKLPKDPKTGKPTSVSNMVAGVAAGIAESVTVVTPGENIKTKMVEDRAGPRQFKSTAHAVRTIIHKGGFIGLYRGVLPVTMKQGSNALVRFTSYNAILAAIQPALDQKKRRGLAPVLAGASAGIITVYVTMPFDVIKTKMQRLQASSAHGGTWQCLTATVSEAGITGLWRGTTPRLARLTVSGALSFSIYEKVLNLTRQPKTRLETLERAV